MQALLSSTVPYVELPVVRQGEGFGVLQQCNVMDEAGPATWEELEAEAGRVRVASLLALLIRGCCQFSSIVCRYSCIHEEGVCVL